MRHPFYAVTGWAPGYSDQTVAHFTKTYRWFKNAWRYSRLLAESGHLVSIVEFGA